MLHIRCYPVLAQGQSQHWSPDFKSARVSWRYTDCRATESLPLCRQAVVHAVLKALQRPALHAKTLGFIHPMTQERLHFTSDLPDDFTASLKSLREL